MNVVPAAHRVKKLAIHMGGGAGRQVESMLERQNLVGDASSQYDFDAGSIGCLGGSLPTRGNACFFTGTPIHGPVVHTITDADAAVRLMPQYDGAFAGVFWDAGRETLVVVTDCLGMQPLYMRHVDGELTLVSETKAIQGSPDLAAWGAFVSIGHPIGERSLLQDLIRVPPASILTFDGKQGRMDIQRYWHWPDPSDDWRDFDFLDALEADMHAFAACGDPGTLLLSGGFDSRLLLFLMVRAGIPAHALIVAHDDEYDDADGRLAEMVVTSTGMPFRKVHPDPDFFSSSDYLEYLRASDVGFPSLDLFIAKVASHIHGTSVWDGLVPGFVFMPLHQPEGGFDAYLRQEVRGNDSAHWRAARLLFRREVCESMQDGFAQDLRAEVSRLPQDSHGLCRFVIENRSRNRASMNPMKVYANQGNAFTPGLSKDFMSHAAIIPVQRKRHGHFYRDLLGRLDPRCLDAPFISGGELMRGRWFSPAFARERLRRAYINQRSRHPSLFPGGSRGSIVRSSFLGEGLLEDHDRWLRDDVRQRLNEPSPVSALAWKLLFYWKAWRWCHEDKLHRMLAPFDGQ